MKIRRATAYALNAIFQLAELGPNECLATRQLAASGDMPVRFLLQVLSQLAKNDLLRSYRGVEGGFALTRPLSEVSLLEVIEACEGPSRIDVPEMCGLSADVQSRLIELLQDLNVESMSQLSGTSLEELRSGDRHPADASAECGSTETRLSSQVPSAVGSKCPVDGAPATDVLDQEMPGCEPFAESAATANGRETMLKTIEELD